MRANTMVGQAARGDKFFKREVEIEKILRQIENGRNILISAPRRIGKTSIMSYIEENPVKDYRIIYLNTEAVNNGNEFFKKLLNTLIREFESFSKYSVFAKGIFNKINGVGKDGVTLSDKELNYELELINFFEKLNLDNEKLIIMIDEYAQTVQNILNNEGKEKAINFLQMNRELRQEDFGKSIQYVYAGSIGLENVVSKIESSSAINDLVSLKVNPLNKDEAKGLINHITKDSGLIFTDDTIDYIMKKVEWLIPYYIQILIDEIDQMESKREIDIIIEIGNIDTAFEQMLEHRNYYSHWHDRLRILNKDEYNFAKEILNLVSENSKISSSEIFNISQKFDSNSFDYKEVLNELKHDGYINNEGNIKEYKFNSPILKEWWYRNVAN